MVNEKIAIIIIGIANIIIILIIIVPQPIIYFAFIILDEILSILQSHLFFYDHWFPNYQVWPFHLLSQIISWLIVSSTLRYSCICNALQYALLKLSVVLLKGLL